jgi:hypothetical protein
MNQTGFVKFVDNLTVYELGIIYTLYSLNESRHTKAKYIELIHPYMCNPKIYSSIVRQYNKIPVYCEVNKKISKTNHIQISTYMLEMINIYIRNNFIYHPQELIARSYQICSNDRDIDTEFSEKNIAKPIYNLVAKEITPKLNELDYIPSNKLMDNIQKTIINAVKQSKITANVISSQLNIWTCVLDYLTMTHTLQEGLIMFGNSTDLIHRKEFPDISDRRKKLPTNFDNLFINIPKFTPVSINPLHIINGESPFDGRIITRYFLPANSPCFMYPPEKYKIYTYHSDPYDPSIDAILAPHILTVLAIHRITIPEENEDRPGQTINVKYTIIDVKITQFIDIIPESQKVPITKYIQSRDPTTKMDILIPI